MKVLRLLRPVDQPFAPWKNGGGLTREVTAFPPGASLFDFAWRASIALVSDAGPFSAFPGVVRMLSVLDGGLYLTLAEQPERLVMVDTPPIVFFGGDTVSGRAVRTPVPVFNLMLRDRWTADVRWWSGVGNHMAADVLLIAREPTRLTVSARSMDLSPYDVAHFRSRPGTIFHVDRAVLRADVHEPSV